MTLREMYAGLDDAVLRYVPDYRVNMIAPGNMTEEEIEEFCSSLKEVILYIKYSKDKEKLQEVAQKNKNFRSLERQAAFHVYDEFFCSHTLTKCNEPVPFQNVITSLHLEGRDHFDME